MAEQSFSQFSRAAQGNMGVPFLLLALLGMMILPVPPFLLDTFFSFNIALSIVILLVAIYSLRPLEFAVFPTMLLIATLLRLALNVASTRVVLLEGHQGGDAAGKVIEAFGEVVIGGNYAVGLVVFLILMIINFVVVTRGAGRISEVSARFTLDAMPGKQMAIDADLNAGILDQEKAKRRREEVAREADFYGSMDGASKFVRGDAIAGILILIINILGGLAIGMAQHDLEFDRAVEVYTLLTIGDGLVAQIPSLLLSTSAAIMVTRVSSESDVRDQVFQQMFDSPKALAVAAGILTIMGVIPGMPHVAFLSLAAGCGAMAWWVARQAQEKSEAEARELEQQQQAQQLEQPEQAELGWDDVTPVDLIGLEVGYRLIPMVDKNQTGELLSRIKGIRKKLSQDIGFLIPAVHIRDNLELQPHEYRIAINGVVVGESEVRPEQSLAINPGQVFGRVEGVETRDPAFGLEALWVDAAQKDQAQSLGYTVVDASTVVATHLNQLLMKHIDEFLGHEEAQQMVERLGSYAPKLADALTPETVPMGMLIKVLRELLKDGIPIRDFRTIAESIVANSALAQSASRLTESVRVALRRSIVQEIYGADKNLAVTTLDATMEQLLNSAASPQSEDLTLEPGLANKLQRAMEDFAIDKEQRGVPAVLLVPATLRPFLSKMARYCGHMLHVLSYNEIPDDKQITIEGSLK